MVKLDMDMPKVCVECPLLNRECNKCEVLDKIRAEIDDATEIHSDGEFYIKNIDVKRIIDKYKGDKE